MTSLSDYFKGTASKYLSAVDAMPTSNQHEIGSNKFTAILGDPSTQKLRFNTTFLFFNPDVDEPESCTDTVTYYDTRLNQPNRRPEYRLYYRDNAVTEQLKKGDFCLIAVQNNGDLLIAVARPDSDHERRLRYLFDVENAQAQWVVEKEIDTQKLDFASQTILEALGVEIKDSADEMLDRIVAKFGLRFPPTKEFSEFARHSLGSDLSAKDDPDRAIEEWMRQEERLFRSLERAIVEVRLEQGFEAVDPFIAFSLSVQNRRKSRVGHAFENHLEAVLKANDIRYQRGGRTEGNSKPDFLFPSETAYHDPNVSSPPLRMLAAKSTCKDRWRQVLAEAARIPIKHLVTLETAISQSQTQEMQANHVQLVTPKSVKSTYTNAQQVWILSLEQFVTLIKV
ncbi:type II restriction endonuclease [Polaromonas aquatica]|uniref:type II restriction endonuclease n=1 Tax=Polaromonas aquatica TaxID=332657 RepID=UPI003D658735